MGCIYLRKQYSAKFWSIWQLIQNVKNAERIHDIMQIKRLAIVWEVLVLYFYVGECRSNFKTDDQSLQWILDLKESTSLLAYWWLPLVNFDVKVQYRDERHKTAADALSQLTTYQTRDFEKDDSVPAYKIVDAYALADGNREEEVEPITTQRYFLAYWEENNDCLLAESPDALNNQYFYNLFGFISTRAHLHLATRNFHSFIWVTELAHEHI